MATIVPPEKVAQARRRYTEGATVRRIMSETRLAQSTVYRCLAGKLDDGSGQKPEPIALRGAAAPAVNRKAVVSQIWRTASQQVQQIEDRLAQGGLKPREHDSNSRALAALVKTVRELSAIDEAHAAKHAARAKRSRKETNDDPVPRDLDEFRRELARRMDAFVDRKLAEESRMGTGVPDRTDG